MNKYLLLLILPLLSFLMSACDDEEDVNSQHINFDMFLGNWELVEQGNQNVFERNCILDITITQIHKGRGEYQGYINTYYLTVNGTPKHDKVFSWSCHDADNSQPVLDVEFQGELDTVGPWTGVHSYKIIKLTDTYMWWQTNADADNTILKFRRRTDIPIN